jgi:hypothetical protein
LFGEKIENSHHFLFDNKITLEKKKKKRLFKVVDLFQMTEDEGEPLLTDDRRQV